MKQWLVVLFSALCVSTGSVGAQEWPTRPVKLIVPYPAGGGVDVMARALAQRLQDKWQQPITIDNRPGANTLIGTEAVAKASDNHTLLFTTDATFTINPHLYSKLPYDAEKDFAPVTQLVAFSQMLVANASLPANNLKDFIAYAKQHPGKLNYASQGNGSVSHIGTEIFKLQTGVNMVHVPYKGSGQAIADVLAGQVEVFITTPPSVMQHVQTGKLKALAVTGKSRHPGMPNVPTVAEAGLANFELESWVALYASAGTPPAVLQKLSLDVKRSMELPETKQRADAAGIEVRYLSPNDTTKVLERETAEWAKAIKTANIKMD